MHLVNAVQQQPASWHGHRPAVRVEPFPDAGQQSGDPGAEDRLGQNRTPIVGPGVALHLGNNGVGNDQHDVRPLVVRLAGLRAAGVLGGAEWARVVHGLILFGDRPPAWNELNLGLLWCDYSSWPRHQIPDWRRGFYW